MTQENQTENTTQNETKTVDSVISNITSMYSEMEKMLLAMTEYKPKTISIGEYWTRMHELKKQFDSVRSDCVTA